MQRQSVAICRITGQRLLIAPRCAVLRRLLHEHAATVPRLCHGCLARGPTTVQHCSCAALCCVGPAIRACAVRWCVGPAIRTCVVPCCVEPCCEPVTCPRARHAGDALLCRSFLRRAAPRCSLRRNVPAWQEVLLRVLCWAVLCCAPGRAPAGTGGRSAAPPWATWRSTAGSACPA
jgi:hypothetical protein